VSRFAVPPSSACPGRPGSTKPGEFSNGTFGEFTPGTHRPWRELCAWTRLGCLARLGTAAGNDRWQAARLVGITKRGNKYLRKLLIHGARAALPTLLESPTPLGGWLRGLMARMHKNAAVVALANKLARIAWAVLRHGETFSIELSTTA
jgi:hypothetical protein